MSETRGVNYTKLIGKGAAGSKGEKNEREEETKKNLYWEVEVKLVKQAKSCVENGGLVRRGRKTGRVERNWAEVADVGRKVRSQIQ